MIGGLVYFDVKNHTVISFLHIRVPLGLPPAINQAFTRNKSIAGYVQATYKITPNLRVTGGLRYTEDKRRVQLRNRRQNGTCLLNTTDTPGVCAATRSGTLDYLSYRSAERRVGKDGVSTCRSRVSPAH